MVSDHEIEDAINEETATATMFVNKLNVIPAEDAIVENVLVPKEVPEEAFFNNIGGHHEVPKEEVVVTGKVVAPEERSFAEDLSMQNVLVPAEIAGMEDNSNCNMMQEENLEIPSARM
jgi:hypothetical protein